MLARDNYQRKRGRHSKYPFGRWVSIPPKPTVASIFDYASLCHERPVQDDHVPSSATGVRQAASGLPITLWSEVS